MPRLRQLANAAVQAESAALNEAVLMWRTRAELAEAALQQAREALEIVDSAHALMKAERDRALDALIVLTTHCCCHYPSGQPCGRDECVGAIARAALLKSVR